MKGSCGDDKSNHLNARLQLAKARCQQKNVLAIINALLTKKMQKGCDKHRWMDSFGAKPEVLKMGKNVSVRVLSSSWDLIKTSELDKSSSFCQ